jgi:hypothetical protein
MSEKQLIKLEITFDQETGMVNLMGPIDDFMFCLGLLEMGKINLKEYRDKKAIDKDRPIESELVH